jgi:hypothetical protein
MISIVKKILYYSITRLARHLSPLKETTAIEITPGLESIFVSLPLNFSRLPGKFATQFVAIKRIPARRIFILKDVFVSGQAVIFKNLKIFKPSLPWLRDLHLYQDGRFLMQQWLQKPFRKENHHIVALIYDDWSAANYYHWMIEALPRLLLARRRFPDCVFIVPEPAPEFIGATLNLLGVDMSLRLDRHSGKVLQASKLIMPELVYYYEVEYASPSKFNSIQTTSGNIPVPHSALKNLNESEELIFSVRELLLEKFESEAKLPHRKIFVSRSRQRTRKLQNEEDAWALLQEYGFERVFFEDKTFNEQVHLMLDTTVLLSVHGANMVNMLFMPHGSTVIELMNEEYLNDAYYLLSSTCKLEYFSIPCKMADKSNKLTRDSVVLNDANLVVDTKYLKETLNMALIKGGG